MFKRFFLGVALISLLVLAGSSSAQAQCYRGGGYYGGYPVYRSVHYYGGPSYYSRHHHRHYGYYGRPGYYGRSRYGYYGGRSGVSFSIGF